MKLHFMPIGLMTIGLGIAISSWVRWTLSYHDLSNALFGIAIGLIIAILGYITNWMKNTDQSIDALRRQADALGSTIFNQEDEARKELAMGVGE